ncbi:MAG: nucleotidyltransferase domain-containing protein [Polyangiaceae bacterium]|nr:nucleotidyltransferase domain-containing protein [Polyangiaceae bacterium]
MTDEERRRATPIAEDVGLELVVLFGSLAAGTARPDSDADLAVRAADRLTWERRLEIAGRMRAAFHRDVDVVDLRTADPFLLRGVFRQPALLHGASERLASERLRAFHRYEDYRPMLALDRRALRRALGLHGD